MSHVHRLRTADRIFITVNLRRALPPLADGEYALMADALVESRRKLSFLLTGYVLMPDHRRWSSYNNFALDKALVAACPVQLDYVHLPESYRG